MKSCFVTCYLIVVVLFATAQDQTAKIKNTANKYVTAFLKNDAPTTVDLMYRKYVTMHGGRDSLIRSIENDNKKNGAQSFKLKDINIGQPWKAVKFGDTLYSVVPEQIIFQAGTALFSLKSSLLAVSFDDGKNWEFAPTADKQWLYSAIPIASKLNIPETTQPTLMNADASSNSLTPPQGGPLAGQLKFIGRRALVILVISKGKEFLADTASMKAIKEKWIKSISIGAFMVNPNDTLKYGKNALNGVNRYVIDDKKYPSVYQQVSKTMKYIGPADRKEEDNN